MFISINAASEAWTNLAEWLQSMSKLLSDADFSSFDMCHSRLRPMQDQLW
jgi:hypothetical protein